MTPITDEAVTKAAWVIAEGNSRAWLTYSDDTRAAIARSWEPTARAALEAAYPATRQQVAEEIAVAIEDVSAKIYYGDRHHLHEAATEAREIGGAS